MYQRIKNKLDMEIIKDFLESEQTNQNVVRRMEELTDILDGAYDGSRGAFDMGGYILFFGDRQTYEDHIAKIMEFYHLDRDLAEYSRQTEGTADSTVQWREELYLLSSDDSLVLIYPKAVEAV